MIGMGADHLLPAMSPRLSIGTEPGKTIARRRAEIFSKRYADGLKPTRGARELLLAFRDGGVARVAATSAKEDELDRLLLRAGIADLISSAFTADDAPAVALRCGGSSDADLAGDAAIYDDPLSLLAAMRIL
jgi:phosphoglycolate phosphatase-like HAD superfamily hydrolase